MSHNAGRKSSQDDEKLNKYENFDSLITKIFTNYIVPKWRDNSSPNNQWLKKFISKNNDQETMNALIDSLSDEKVPINSDDLGCVNLSMARQCRIELEARKDKNKDVLPWLEASLNLSSQHIRKIAFTMIHDSKSMAHDVYFISKKINMDIIKKIFLAENDTLALLSMLKKLIQSPGQCHIYDTVENRYINNKENAFDHLVFLYEKYIVQQFNNRMILRKFSIVSVEFPFKKIEMLFDRHEKNEKTCIVSRDLFESEKEKVKRFRKELINDYTLQMGINEGLHKLITRMLSYKLREMTKYKYDVLISIMEIIEKCILERKDEECAWDIPFAKFSAKKHERLFFAIIKIAEKNIDVNIFHIETYWLLCKLHAQYCRSDGVDAKSTPSVFLMEESKSGPLLAPVDITQSITKKTDTIKQHKKTIDDLLKNQISIMDFEKVINFKEPGNSALRRSLKNTKYFYEQQDLFFKSELYDKFKKGALLPTQLAKLEKNVDMLLTCYKAPTFTIEEFQQEKIKSEQAKQQLEKEESEAVLVKSRLELTDSKSDVSHSAIVSSMPVVETSKLKNTTKKISSKKAHFDTRKKKQEAEIQAQKQKREENARIIAERKVAEQRKTKSLEKDKLVILEDESTKKSEQTKPAEKSALLHKKQQLEIQTPQEIKKLEKEKQMMIIGKFVEKERKKQQERQAISQERGKSTILSSSTIPDQIRPTTPSSTMPDQVRPAISPSGTPILAQARPAISPSGTPMLAQARPAISPSGTPMLAQARPAIPPSGTPMFAQARPAIPPSGTPMLAQARPAIPPSGTPMFAQARPAQARLAIPPNGTPMLDQARLVISPSNTPMLDQARPAISPSNTPMLNQARPAIPPSSRMPTQTGPIIPPSSAAMPLQSRRALKRSDYHANIPCMLELKKPISASTTSVVLNNDTRRKWEYRCLALKKEYAKEKEIFWTQLRYLQKIFSHECPLNTELKKLEWRLYVADQFFQGCKIEKLETDLVNWRKQSGRPEYIYGPGNPNNLLSTQAQMTAQFLHEKRHHPNYSKMKKRFDIIHRMIHHEEKVTNTCDLSLVTYRNSVIDIEAVLTDCRRKFNSSPSYLLRSIEQCELTLQTISFNKQEYIERQAIAWLHEMIINDDRNNAAGQSVDIDSLMIYLSYLNKYFRLDILYAMIANYIVNIIGFSPSNRLANLLTERDVSSDLFPEPSQFLDSDSIGVITTSDKFILPLDGDFIHVKKVSGKFMLLPNGHPIYVEKDKKHSNENHVIEKLTPLLGRESLFYRSRHHDQSHDRVMLYPINQTTCKAKK